MAERQDGKTVVLAVDGSAGADCTIDWYYKYIHKKGDKVICVHTVESRKALDENWAIISSGDQVSQKWQSQVDQARTLIAKYDKKLKDMNVPATMLLLQGQAGPVIVKAAEQNHADMVVMGTRGLSRLRRTVLGSVSDYVLHHVHCTVMIHRPE